MIERRRLSDQRLTGWRAVTCWCAQRASDFWEWVDKRQIDAYALLAIIVFGTIRITDWAMRYVELHPDDAGTDVGLKVAAVMVPWSLIATPAIKWYFDARRGTFSVKQ